MIDTRDLWQIKRIGTTMTINLGERMALKFRRLNQSTRDWDTLVRRRARPQRDGCNPCVPMLCGSI